jgi:hypothetical protein
MILGAFRETGVQWDIRGSRLNKDMRHMIFERVLVLTFVTAMHLGCSEPQAESSKPPTPSTFSPQQSVPKPPPPPWDERETKVLPLDSDNCTVNDRELIDSTFAQVVARCDRTGPTTRVRLTVLARTTDPANYFRELSLRFCGDVINAEGASGWKTAIVREKGRDEVAADVTWELDEPTLKSKTPPPIGVVGFAVTLRGRWRRGYSYSVAFSEGRGPIEVATHDCPYPYR